MPSIACIAIALRKDVFPVPFLPTRPEMGKLDMLKLVEYCLFQTKAVTDPYK
jgi:hypothetical protein